MTARELLSDLLTQGFSLTPLPGEKIEIKPWSKLTDELRQALRQNKTEILTLLRAPQQMEQPIDLVCPHCGGKGRVVTGHLSMDGSSYIQFMECLSWRCRKWSKSFRLQ